MDLISWWSLSGGYFYFKQAKVWEGICPKQKKQLMRAMFPRGCGLQFQLFQLSAEAKGSVQSSCSTAFIHGAHFSFRLIKRTSPFSF